MKMMIGVNIASDETAHELSDQRPDQARGLCETDADHHHEDDRDRREVAEVGDEGREDEADPVCREQALDRRRLLDDRVVAFLNGRVRETAGRLRGAALDDLLDRDRRRLCDLERDADVCPREQRGEDDHDHAQVDEQERGVRHLVAAALDGAENALHHPPRRLHRYLCGRVAHDASEPPECTSA